MARSPLTKLVAALPVLALAANLLSSARPVVDSGILDRTLVNVWLSLGGALLVGLGLILFHSLAPRGVRAFPSAEEQAEAILRRDDHRALATAITTLLPDDVDRRTDTAGWRPGPRDGAITRMMEAEWARTDRDNSGSNFNPIPMSSPLFKPVRDTQLRGAKAMAQVHHLERFDELLFRLPHDPDGEPPGAVEHLMDRALQRMLRDKVHRHEIVATLRYLCGLSEEDATSGTDTGLTRNRIEPRGGSEEWKLAEALIRFAHLGVVHVMTVNDLISDADVPPPEAPLTAEAREARQTMFFRGYAPGFENLMATDGDPVGRPGDPVLPLGEVVQAYLAAYQRVYGLDQLRGAVVDLVRDQWLAEAQVRPVLGGATVCLFGGGAVLAAWPTAENIVRAVATALA